MNLNTLDNKLDDLYLDILDLEFRMVLLLKKIKGFYK